MEIKYFEIKPITLIYGNNGTGKSSIIQLLQLLKQSLQNKSEAILSPKINSEDSVDLGSYEEFIYRHDKKNKLSITFHGEFSERFDDPALRIKISTIDRNNEIAQKKKQSLIKELIEKNVKHRLVKFNIKLDF